MKYRPFGKAGWEASEIGFGAWGIGGSWWGQNTDDKSALEALHRAADLGINFFDTALVYGMGHSEELIGKVMKVRRDPPKVATKVPPKNMQWPAKAATPARDAFPGEWISQNVEKSLKNLGVECLDLVQFHVWTDRWLDEAGEWQPAVEKLKKQGKIRHWGVSVNDHEPESALKLAASGLADSLQVIYNIFDQSAAERLFPLCQKHKVAVINRVALDEGGLAGTFTSETTFGPDDFRRSYFKGSRLAETLARVDPLKVIAKREGFSLAELALRFCLSHPAVTTVIAGMRKPSRVEENVRASDGRTLSEETLKELKTHAWPRNFYIE